MKIVTAVGLTCLLATACGSTDATSDDAGGEPTATRPLLPQRLDRPDMNPDLEPAAPADAAPFADRLEHELTVQTLDMAQAEGVTTAECPADIKAAKGKKTTCTTTYEGLRIEWTVTFGDAAAWSSDHVEYEAKPSTGIITRAGVAKLLFGNFKGYIDHALCNGIPKATLAPLNAKSTYECEVVDKGKEPTGIATSTVRATENGPRAY
jgi:hypothetical protein